MWLLTAKVMFIPNILTKHLTLMKNRDKNLIHFKMLVLHIFEFKVYELIVFVFG